MGAGQSDFNAVLDGIYSVCQFPDTSADQEVVIESLQVAPPSNRKNGEGMQQTSPGGSSSRQACAEKDTKHQAKDEGSFLTPPKMLEGVSSTFYKHFLVLKVKIKHAIKCRKKCYITNKYVQQVER